MSLANKITITRLVFIPFFVLLLLYFDQSVRAQVVNEALRNGALFLFLLIAIGDGLDGYLARSRHEITRLGTIIDPLADKAVLLSALILLSHASPATYRTDLPLWFLWLVVGRDLMLMIGSGVIHLINGAVRVRPRISGKVTTFLQMAIVVWILGDVGGRFFAPLLWGAVFFTAMSGIQYFYDGVRQLHGQRVGALKPSE